VGSLLLIRHGQASFAAEDYDVLSPLGEAQARLLGAHLARVRLDAVYSGPRRRQLETARGARQAAEAAGARWPEIVILDELDEFPFEQVLRIGMREIADAAARAEPLIGAQGGFSSAFHLVMERWIEGRLAGDFERWVDFIARVERGLERILAAEAAAGQPGRRAAVVTSGGPIAITLRRALALSDAVTLRMQAVIANASVSELKHRRGAGGELTLTSFNSVHHLQTDHVTYR
jgi:broad specificity phosphatase PhoE